MLGNETWIFYCGQLRAVTQFALHLYLWELTPTPDLQIWPSSKLTPYDSFSLEMVCWPTAGHLIKLDQIQTCRSWSPCVTEPLKRNHRNCGCEAKKANLTELGDGSSDGESEDESKLLLQIMSQAASPPMDPKGEIQDTVHWMDLWDSKKVKSPS